MASIARHHLQYRLWISDLNADINVLRIFDDYLADSKAKNKDDSAKEKLSDYKKEFAAIRKELDEVRHEMYLNKMKLAAVVKKGESGTDDVEELINHTTCKERYKVFRKKFKALKKEFKKFEV